MRDLVYLIGLSIDGFIAGPDDQVDCYPLSDEYMAWMNAEFPDALRTSAGAWASMPPPTGTSTPS